MLTEEEKVSGKMHSTARGLVFQRRPGVSVKNTLGTTDNRLLTGEGTVVIYFDSIVSLWGFRYTHGVMPQPLQNKFTSFSKAKAFAEHYYGRRGLDIIEYKDL